MPMMVHKTCTNGFEITVGPPEPVEFGGLRTVNRAMGLVVVRGGPRRRAGRGP
jgi:hypothetical protein